MANALHGTSNFRLPHITLALSVAAIVLAGCARTDAPGSSTAPSAHPAAGVDDAKPGASERTPPPAATATAVGTSDAAIEPADPPASLPEPGPAAINTPQAAATAVETYFGLLEGGRTADADAMWGDASQAAKFRADFAALGEYHAEVGAPGGVEAAAGSMYVTVPLRFIPAASVPNQRPRMGEAVMRRVNDVPGSTAAQRRWHVERIDVAMTPK